MNRKSCESRGFVAFPVNDPSWINSMQGGMVVKLVVYDSEDEVETFRMCFGADVYDAMTAEFIGDDQCPQPAPVNTGDAFADVITDNQNSIEWTARIFPQHGESDDSGPLKYLSIPCLAAIVLGTTGWSGMRNFDNWFCTYDDLTPDGKALYDSMQKLYPHGKLHLLTYLDT